MKILPERLFSSMTIVVSLAAILVVLAVLQYRWSGQVSEAEHERMRANLRNSMDQFRLQFNNEFRQLGFSLQPNATILMQKDWKSYAASCDSLLRASSHHLVSNIYLLIAGGDDGSQLLKLNRDLKNFETASWPSNFETVRERYNRLFSNMARPEPEMRPFMSTFLHRIPLILQPLNTFQGFPGPSGSGMHFIGFLLIELNRESLRDELFPELAQKYFKGPDGFIYQVAVLGGLNYDTFLYQSDPNLTTASLGSPDARIGLLENRFGPMMPRPERDMDVPDRGNPGPPSFQFRPDLQSSNGRRRRGPGFFDDPGSGWELVAKHRVGSLEAAVAGTRRRNLAFSFGSLLLLGVSTAFIIASARRAQSLARLQIDFVAGISHELRTPLAVICSAGDNLADGVVTDASHSTRKYGELIRDEGRKLAGMIEQILQYTGGQKGRRRYNLQPEHLNEIADAALNQAQPAITAAGFSVEKSYAPDLPQIHVDATALSQAIQNLIQNALKYSGQNRRLSIRTSKAKGKRAAEVQLIVEDKGMGIASAELPHIFEPFYRGSAATAAQIHGTGLGLYMVREALTSMNGSVSVKSSPGKGSIFTIHMPALSGNDNSQAREG
jgi:signal transduction histidine kinase